MNKYSNIFVYKRLCQQLEKTHAAWEKLEFIVLESSGIQENTQFEIHFPCSLSWDWLCGKLMQVSFPKIWKILSGSLSFLVLVLIFPYMGILRFVLTYLQILRWLFSSVSSIKHIAMHWTMYCAMSFRWHNFQSIVDTFKTINYDKVVRSVMNEILVIYCNSSI